MTAWTINTGRSSLMALQKKMAAYEHALGLLYYDGATGAPKETAENRGVSYSILSEDLYKLSTGEETAQLLSFLDDKVLGTLALFLDKILEIMDTVILMVESVIDRGSHLLTGIISAA